MDASLTLKMNWNVSSRTSISVDSKAEQASAFRTFSNIKAALYSA